MGYGERALVLRRAMTSLHTLLATAVVEVTTRDAKHFGVALVSVQQGVVGWSMHYGYLWGSIPRPPTRETTVVSRM